MLWGVDELLTYHYLIAEVYRVVPPSRLPYEQFWQMTRAEQADHIWRNLFVERSPVSEACRGVITALTRLGLDPNVTDLAPLRRWFAEQEPNQFVDRVMELSHYVERILMTNSVFDDNERRGWLEGQWSGDSRFAPVLRIDPLLLDWPNSSRVAARVGLRREPARWSMKRTQGETRRFLRDWIGRMKPVYVAVSLPPWFRYPANDPSVSAAAGTVHFAEHMLRHAVLPVCREAGLPFAMMIGAIRGTNPELRDAGDMGGAADVQSVVSLCRDFGDNRFLVTMLARENQHELVVAARKFSNLIIFGCWWFVNNPSLIDEITRMLAMNCSARVSSRSIRMRGFLTN